jgi:hypothetical protein
MLLRLLLLLLLLLLRLLLRLLMVAAVVIVALVVGVAVLLVLVMLTFLVNAHIGNPKPTRVRFVDSVVGYFALSFSINASSRPANVRRIISAKQ